MFGGIGSRLIVSNTASRDSKALTSSDITTKCTKILSELDRCINCKDKTIDSSILHDNVPQTFATEDLRRELEAELDRLLLQQLLMEEKLTESSLVETQGRISTPSDQPTTCTIDEEACSACNSSPCQWRPSYDTAVLTKRKRELNRECILAAQKSKEGNTKAIKSIIARSVLNGGDIHFNPSELLEELTDELKEIGSKLKLCKVDEELHKTFASTSESVTVRSIHEFETTVKRDDAIVALEREHNRHTAKIVATETIDDILEW